MIAAQRQRGWHRRIAAFYKEHNPARAADVPRIMLQWRGEESKLWRCLQEKYCDAATAMATPRSPEDGSGTMGLDDLDAILDKSFDFGSAKKQAKWCVIAMTAICCNPMRATFAPPPPPGLACAGAETMLSCDILCTSANRLYDPLVVSPTATSATAAKPSSGASSSVLCPAPTPSRLPRPSETAGAQRHTSSHAARSSGSHIPAPSAANTAADDWLQDHTVLFDSDSGANPVPMPLASQSKWVARLAEFYATHNPSKISQVEHILSQWVGQEEEMFVCLEQKYGVGT